MNNNLAYQYQDDRREELINGNAVAMSPSPVWSHVSVAGNIYRVFGNYLKGKKCTPIQDGFDLHLTEKDVFIPDMMVVCDRGKIKRNGVYGAPDLVVEILSPSTAKNDRGYKKDVYEASGVAEYWIVDPLHKFIEVYLLQDGHYAIDNIYTLYPAEELEEMTDEEKAMVVTEFQCHLYDDLTIRLEDIFQEFI